MAGERGNKLNEVEDKAEQLNEDAKVCTMTVLYAAHCTELF